MLSCAPGRRRETNTRTHLRNNSDAPSQKSNPFHRDSDTSTMKRGDPVVPTHALRARAQRQRLERHIRTRLLRARLLMETAAEGTAAEGTAADGRGC